MALDYILLNLVLRCPPFVVKGQPRASCGRMARRLILLRSYFQFNVNCAIKYDTYQCGAKETSCKGAVAF